MKAEAYALLNEGQRALFIFRAWFDHARRSTAEFYWWCAEFVSRPKSWTELQAGFAFFEAEAMVKVLENTERRIELKLRQPDGSWREARVDDLETDTELLADIQGLEAGFQAAAEETLARIAAYIRAHPHEFVQLED